jgi:hypothetical protein
MTHWTRVVLFYEGLTEKEKEESLISYNLYQIAFSVFKDIISLSFGKKCGWHENDINLGIDLINIVL